MRLLPKKKTARENADTWIQERGVGADPILDIKPSFSKHLKAIPHRDSTPERIIEKNIQPLLSDQNYINLNANLRQNRKHLQRHWRLLRKLNGRFRKKVCKQQQLRADIIRLQKQILEVKQGIIKLNQ